LNDEAGIQFERTNFSQPFPFTHGEELERGRKIEIIKYRAAVNHQMQGIQSKKRQELGNRSKKHLIS
jgi:hypothetical protein